MTTKLELSRNQLYGIIAVLIAALLWIWLKWPAPPPPSKSWQPTSGSGLILDEERFNVPSALKDRLKEKGYPVIMLPNMNGGIKLVNLDGGQIEPCESSNGLEDPECQLNKVTVRTINQITISVVTEGNPTNCMYIRVDGARVKVHADGPNAGLKPCEPTSSHTHYVP